MYDADARRLQPEILAQLVILARLDWQLFANSRDAIEELFVLDAGYAEAIVHSASNKSAALAKLRTLFPQAFTLKSRIDAVFGAAVR